MDMMKMMKQAQKMQQDMQVAQEALGKHEVEASVANGKVTVTATAAGDVTAIRIAKDVVDPEDVEMLEDLVLTAVKQALRKGRDYSDQEMKKITGGMGLPPGMGF